MTSLYVLEERVRHSCREDAGSAWIQSSCFKIRTMVIPSVFVAFVIFLYCDFGSLRLVPSLRLIAPTRSSRARLISRIALLSGAEEQIEPHPLTRPASHCRDRLTVDCSGLPLGLLFGCRPALMRNVIKSRLGLYYRGRATQIIPRDRLQAFVQLINERPAGRDF